MNSNVTVAADATTNAVISISANNPEYGFVRFQQTRTMIDESGFLRRKTVSSLIHAPISMLQEMKYYAGQIIPGNIVVFAPIDAPSFTNVFIYTPFLEYSALGVLSLQNTIDGPRNTLSSQVIPLYIETLFCTLQLLPNLAPSAIKQF